MSVQLQARFPLDTTNKRLGLLQSLHFQVKPIKRQGWGESCRIRAIGKMSIYAVGRGSEAARP